MNYNTKNKRSAISTPVSVLLLAVILLTGFYSQTGTYKLLSSLLCVGTLLVYGEAVFVQLSFFLLRPFFKKSNEQITESEL